MRLVSLARQALADGLDWCGVDGDALPYVLAEVAADGRWLIVVDGADVAWRLYDALRFLHPHPARVWVYPPDDVRPYDGFSPGSEVVGARVRALTAVDREGPVVVIAVAAALSARVPSRAARRRATLRVARGDRIDRDVLVRHLQAHGYLGVGRVEDRGTYAVRGDVVDLWPIGDHPVRIDFFDDEVEDLRRLEPSIQRPGPKLAAVTVEPAREEPLHEASLDRLGDELGRLISLQARGVSQRRRITEDLRAGIRFGGVESWLPALVDTEPALAAFADLRPLVVHPASCVAAVAEADRIARERWSALDDDERPLVPPDERYVPVDDLRAAFAAARAVRELPGDGAVALGAAPPQGFLIKQADLAPVVGKIRALVRDGCAVGLVADDAKRAQQLVEMLGNHGLDLPLVSHPRQIPPASAAALFGPLRRGFVAQDSGLALIPTGALFGERQSRRAEKAHAFFDSAVTSLSELKEGDHVVHRLHGVGIYRGLLRVPVQIDLPRTDTKPRQVATGVAVAAQDFVRVEYRDADLLLLPVTRLDALSRFVPAHDGAEIKLDRLGGVTWAARKGKVRDSILAMATDLLAIYARREVAERAPYRSPGEAYAMFEARFPYDETPDQAAAIAAVNEDLLADAPMDRLVCGDVGYGKTEVAMRATMRVAESGRQVVVLCPTTVLAFQHLRTFEARFDGFPVRIAMLSRFTSATDERRILAGLKDGTVDVVIGTTRLLGRGVKFRDLGLVVVDEEHRFGVTQKEKLKKWRAEVDYLAMSATPIPRTLQMALSGMRAMSIMATPPRDRLSVRTSVAVYGRARVRDAILHELEREGQVYFVHNRVEDIEAVAKELAEWVPEARFLVAHGQMGDDELEEALVGFVERKADVLVSSAIIESGVDLPNVNTMIVNRADRFGLAQLYQLRGRVGRGSARATCLLLVPDKMTPDSKRRIRTIAEHADLGAGFRIAMADLEIRGAGNLLGDSQSGNIDQIGYDAYLELLQEAIDEARGTLDAARVDPEVEVPVAAFLPDALFPDVPERLSRYRALADASSEREIDAWIGDIEERAGADLPEPAVHLAEIARVRLLCRSTGVVRLAWQRVRVVLEFHPRSKAAPPILQRARERAAENPKRWTVTVADDAPRVEVRFLPQEAERPLRFLRWVFAQLQRPG